MTWTPKPGDVGMVMRSSTGREERAACVVSDGRKLLVWQFPDGDWTFSNSCPARPLVVIDPEDAEQVRRLSDAFAEAWLEVSKNASEGGPGVNAFNVMPVAVSKFAHPKPPRPEEPMGLAAVVEDADGARWVRNDRRVAPRWHSQASGFRDWRDIDAVEVIRQGVTP